MELTDFVFEPEQIEEHMRLQLCPVCNNPMTHKDFHLEYNLAYEKVYCSHCDCGLDLTWELSLLCAEPFKLVEVEDETK